MNAMYSADQINVPSELGTIMKQYTKAVMRDKPVDVYKYSANFFAILSGRAAPFDADGQLRDEGVTVVRKTTSTSQADTHAEETQAVPETWDEVFFRFDVDGEGFMKVEDLPYLLTEVRNILGLGEEELSNIDDILNSLTINDGMIDLIELRCLLFDEAEQ